MGKYVGREAKKDESHPPPLPWKVFETFRCSTRQGRHHDPITDMRGTNQRKEDIYRNDIDMHGRSRVEVGHGTVNVMIGATCTESWTRRWQ